MTVTLISFKDIEKIYQYINQFPFLGSFIFYSKEIGGDGVVIRKEIGYLKLTTVLIQLLIILMLAPVTKNFVDQLFGGLLINELTLFILFLLHGYTYRECSRSRMLKSGHLFGITAVMFQVSIPLYVLSTLILGVETYLLIANRWPFKANSVNQIKKIKHK